jgi:hypothetical protein
MTPKEKAHELIVKALVQFEKLTINEAKKIALIALDEVMKAPFENTYWELVPDDAPDSDWFWDTFRQYWNEVKQEIEKL